jgi:hypothetical protein
MIDKALRSVRNKLLGTKHSLSFFFFRMHRGRASGTLLAQRARQRPLCIAITC